VGAQIALPGDVTDVDHVRRLAIATQEAFGRVDIVVNNAGNAQSESFLKTSRELWDRMFAVNATSAFLVSREFLPAMLRQGSGRIVMIASISSKRGAPYIAAYAAAKHALLGMARSLAEEVRGKGILVNSVCPHYVDTPLTDASIANIVKRTGKSVHEARAMLGAMNPQKRLITPEEVARLVLEYAVPTCSITGEAADL
jgi:NAD(P)-dependent dehydrogenase (short-subunit alcohol dehydrogenase family)